MRPRSLNSNQLLRLSHWNIHENCEKIHPLIQEISYIQDYDLEDRVNVTKDIVNSLDCPKGIAVLNRWASSHRFKRYINFWWNFHIFKFSCDLENELKFTKIESALKLALVVHLCKFEENPFIVSRDILDTRL